MRANIRFRDSNMRNFPVVSIIECSIHGSYVIMCFINEITMSHEQWNKEIRFIVNMFNVEIISCMNETNAFLNYRVFHVEINIFFFFISNIHTMKILGENKYLLRFECGGS